MSTDKFNMNIDAIDQSQLLKKLSDVLLCKNDSELGEKLGVSVQAISNYRTNRRRMSLELLKFASSVSGLSIDGMLDISGSGGNKPSQFEQDFTTVPLYKARLSGGHGSLENSDLVKADIAFRSEFIHRKGNGKNLAMFEVTGDSMEPFIHDGDIVMVDRSHDDPREIVDGKAYAFREDDTVKVKRLSRQGGKLFAISENSTKYPSYEVDTNNFTLFGRVVWLGHEVN